MNVKFINETDKVLLDKEFPETPNEEQVKEASRLDELRFKDIKQITLKIK